MLNPVATTSGQFASLSSVSHSSSGDWVALAGEARKEGREGERGLVVLWSPITGMTRPLVSSPEKVTAVSFSPGGKYLLIGTDVASEAEVRLIDVQTGQDAIPVKKFKHGIKAGAVSKQANRIAVSTDEGKALAWNGGNSKPILEFSDAANVQAISFAPDGMRLAVVGCYHQPGPYGGKGWASIDVIEIDSGKKTSCSVSSTKFITAVEFSRDGTELLVGTDTGYACAPHLLRLDSEDLRQIARLDMDDQPPSYSYVSQVAFHPDGSRIVGVGGGSTSLCTGLVGRIRVWERTANRKLYWVDVPSTATGLAFSSSGDRLVTVHKDGSAIAWEVDAQELSGWADAVPASLLVGNHQLLKAANFSRDSDGHGKLSIPGSIKPDSGWYFEYKTRLTIRVSDSETLTGEVERICQGSDLNETVIWFKEVK